ncbi:hypothetical protein D3C86_1396330 [compost metagenome]
MVALLHGGERLRVTQVVHCLELDLGVGHGGVEADPGDDAVVRHLGQRAHVVAELTQAGGRHLQAQHLTALGTGGHDGDGLLVLARLALSLGLRVDVAAKLVLRAGGTRRALRLVAIGAGGHAVVAGADRSNHLVRVPRALEERFGHTGVGVDDHHVQVENLQGHRLLAGTLDVEATALEADRIDGGVTTGTSGGEGVDAGIGSGLLHEGRESCLLEGDYVGHGKSSLRLAVVLLAGKGVGFNQPCGYFFCAGVVPVDTRRHLYLLQQQKVLCVLLRCGFAVEFGSVFAHPYGALLCADHHFLRI